MTAKERIEQQVAAATTIELLEEVDRRLTEKLFDPHREVRSVAPHLTDQTQFQFAAALFHTRNAVMNYNLARSLQNDVQKTHDFDKGATDERTSLGAA